MYSSVSEMMGSSDSLTQIVSGSNGCDLYNGLFLSFLDTTIDCNKDKNYDVVLQQTDYVL